MFDVGAGPPEPRVWTPEEFGLARSSLAGVRVDDPNQEASGRTAPEQSAAIIDRVLAGERGTARDLVVINAAAGLLAAQAEVDPRAAAERAAEVIDSGAARELLAQLVRATNG